MKSKAQISIFIITGVVLAAAILLFFFLRSQAGIAETPSSAVAAEVQPVYSFIDGFLEDKSLQGLEILRLQGGYIYLPNDAEIIEIETAGEHIVNSGDGIDIVQGTGKTKIPLWLNKDSMAAPSLSFMESQMNLFLKNEMLALDLSEFEKKGMAISMENISINVSLKNFVSVNVNWPMNVKFKEQTYRFEKFTKKIDVDFASVYDVASSLLIYELGYNYLEYHAKSLMSLYSYAGGSKQPLDLPPVSFTDSNTDCNSVSWTKPEVESSMKTIFQTGYPYLKMAKTNFDRAVSSNPMSQGTYDSFIYDYFPEMKNIRIDFFYSPDSRLDLAINPSSLAPERISQNKIPFLPSFCTFNYEFQYQFSTPIVVKVKDSNTFNIREGKLAEKGIEFYFPMKVSICNDQPRTCSTEPQYDIDISAIESLTGKRFYDCGSIEKEAEIYVTDEAGIALNNADVTHKCAGFVNDCWLGRTQNGKAVISLPKCANATLEISKEGYSAAEDKIKSSYALQKSNPKNFSLNVKLVKADKFMAAYYLTNGFQKSSCGKSPQMLLSESIYTPSAKDSILLNFKSRAIPVSFPSSKIIELSAGKYSVSTIVNSNVRIHPSSYNGVVVGYNQKNKNEDYVGNWLMGASSYTFYITNLDTSGKSRVTFYAPVENLATEDLSVKSFENPVIQTGMLSGNIEADENCDGKTETKNVTILEKDYINFIKPKFD